MELSQVRNLEKKWCIYIYASTTFAAPVHSREWPKLGGSEGGDAPFTFAFVSAERR